MSSNEKCGIDNEPTLKDTEPNNASKAPASGEADLALQVSELKAQLKDLASKFETLSSKEIECGKPKKAETLAEELSTVVKRLPMEDWQPLKGFDHPEIRSNVLVVYQKTVTQLVETSWNDGKGDVKDDSEEEGKEKSIEEPREETREKTGEETREETTEETGEEIREEIREETCEVTGEEIREEIREENKEEMTDESKDENMERSGQPMNGDVPEIFERETKIESTETTNEVSHNTEPSKQSNFKQIVQRIQINSRPLLDELEFITGTSMTKTPTVVVPPFKIFIDRRGAIEKELQAKERAIENQTKSDEGNPKIGPVTEKSHDVQEANTRQRTAANHLRCLLEFIDKDLQHTLELRKNIEAGAAGPLKKIAFDDLWHLFKPGDLVFPASEKTARHGELSYERAFRVYSVTGGRTYISGRANIFGDQSGQQAGERKGDQGVKDPTKSTAQSLRWPLQLGLHYADFDGNEMGPQVFDPSRSIIANYSGEKSILELEFYPARFHKDFDAVKGRLIERGSKFLGLANQCHRLYNGLTVGEDPEHVQCEVIIDLKTGYALGELPELKPLDIGSIEFPNTRLEETFELTGCGDNACLGCTNNYNDGNFDQKLYEEYNVDYIIGSFCPAGLKPDELSEFEDQLILAPREVIGYALRNRRWHYLNIDLVTEIDKQKLKEQSGFDDLVIDEKNKKLVLALVENHHSEKASVETRDTESDLTQSQSMDLVPGKGKGLVILLHGAPGVGKTSTAETVAAHTARPLYPITCGDIGQDAAQVERLLEKHFKLAHRWGCVLLLDEADIFLAKRDNKDVHRNALVSVFLRTLEYYSGILFLTTNRVGVIDEAFASRIHVPLYYPPLDEESTEKIWENSLRKIKKNNKNADVRIKFDEETILEYAVDHFRENSPPKGSDAPSSTWNGRQIRNAFQTALALAQYDRVDKIRKAGLSEEEAATHKEFKKAELKRKHFKQVGSITKDYFNYVKEAHKGKAWDEVAALAEERADWPSSSSGPIPQPMPTMGFSLGRGFNGIGMNTPHTQPFIVPGRARDDEDQMKEKGKKKKKRDSTDEDEERNVTRKAGKKKRRDKKQSSEDESEDVVKYKRKKRTSSDVGDGEKDHEKKSNSSSDSDSD